jgi:hypothetical protein
VADATPVRHRQAEQRDHLFVDALPERPHAEYQSVPPLALGSELHVVQSLGLKRPA